MRLIDADAKIIAQLYDDEHEDWIQKEMTVADYLSFSDTAIPFVDVAPVVRCGECIHNYGLNHRGKYNSYDILCDYWGLGGLDSQDFCSCGKLKEGDDG